VILDAATVAPQQAAATAGERGVICGPGAAMAPRQKQQMLFAFNPVECLVL
jgi:hypothetical protein